MRAYGDFSFNIANLKIKFKIEYLIFFDKLIKKIMKII